MCLKSKKEAVRTRFLEKIRAKYLFIEWKQKRKDIVNICQRIFKQRDKFKFEKELDWRKLNMEERDGSWCKMIVRDVIQPHHWQNRQYTVPQRKYQRKYYVAWYWKLSFFSSTLCINCNGMFSNNIIFIVSSINNNDMNSWIDP